MVSSSFKYEEIAPRALKPALLELDGISRAAVEAHYKLYQGYVAKRNEILGQLADVDLGSANQVYSEFRALKVELTFAIGGIKNHEIYFEHLGGGGGDPDGAIARPDRARLRLGRRVARRPEGDRHGRRAAGRGRRTTGTRAGSSTTSATRRTRSPCGTRRRSSRSTSTSTRTSSTTRPTARRTSTRSSTNLDWGVVNDWVGRVRQIQRTRSSSTLAHRRRLPRRLGAVRVLARPAVSSTRTSASVGSGNIGATNVWRDVRRGYGVPVVVLDMAKGFVPALVCSLTVSPLAGVLAGAAAMLGHCAADLPALREGREDGRDAGGAFLGVAPLVGLSAPSCGSSSSSSRATRRVASMRRGAVASDRRLAARRVRGR